MKKEELIGDDTYLFEMSNLRKHETGLPVNIYISDGRSYGNKIPRLKIMTSTSDNMDPHNTVSIMIKKNITEDDIIGYDRIPSSVFSAVKKYINLNYDTLVQFWNGEIGTTELGNKLKRLQ